MGSVSHPGITIPGMPANAGSAPAGADWLAELAPPHAPPPPSIWPLAPGWWLLIALVLAGAIWTIRFVRDPRRAQRRVGRDALQALAAQPVMDANAYARELNLLLRRFAILRFGAEAVAALSGEAWVAFVIARGGSAWARPCAVEGWESLTVGQAMQRAAYGGVPYGAASQVSPAATSPAVPNPAATNPTAVIAQLRAAWLAGAQGFIDWRGGRLDEAPSSARPGLFGKRLRRRSKTKLGEGQP